jgi:hypothetical protein
MATPLKYIPVDMGKLLRPIVMIGGQVKANRDGEIKKDPKTGLPWWQYGIAVRVADTRSAAVITVQAPGEQAGIEEGMLVHLVDPVASPWEMADGSGVTFSATAIVPATASTQTGPAPASTGTASAAPAAGGASRPKAGDAG